MLNAHRPEVAQFVSALFRYADPGTYVSLRAFDQFDRGKAAILIQGMQVGNDLTSIIDGAHAAAQKVANLDFAAVFAPPVATFKDAQRARDIDLANGVAISVDLDEGDARIAVARLESLLGPATLTMVSGSEWTDPVTGELVPKLHVHWRLSEPTRTPEEHGKLRHARWLAAALVGADRSGAPSVHPLRWPGSWNRKGSPRMAMVASANDGAEVHLEEALARLEEAVEAAGLEKGTEPRVSSEPQANAHLIASALDTLSNNDLHWDEWVRIGMAAWRATGASDAGLEAWKSWSMKSSKYVAGACDERWTHFGTSPPTRVGAGLIFWLAAREGWVRPYRMLENPEPTDGAGDPRPEPPVEGRSSGRSQFGKNQFVWPDPLDLFASDDFGMPPLSPSHLPAALWPFVIDTAERMGVEPSSVALIAIASCSAVINDAWHIQPKRNDWSWTEQPRFWSLIVGDPSIMKSPVITICTKPVVKLELEARKRHNEAMRLYKQDLASFKADKNGDVPEPKLPRLDRYMVEGTTVEALSEVLRTDEEAKQRAPASKVLVRQDEMSEFFASLDRYKAGGKGGGDRGAYLRLYNGGPYVVDRVARGTLLVSNWSASFVGGVQPDPIRNIAGEAAEDGLLQRFNYDVPVRQGRGLDRAPDSGAWKRYEGLFPALSALYPPSQIGTSLRSAVVLHDHAHRYREDIDTLVRAVSSFPDTSKQMKAALGKWPGLFARLLLIFHLVNVADAAAAGTPRPYETVVPECTAACVSAYMQDILLPNLMRAEAVMYSTKQTGRARDIAGLILAKGFIRVTIRDVQRGYPALRDPGVARDVTAVMDSLVSIGWLEPEVPENPVKPVHSWLINPKVHIVFASRRGRELAARERAKTESAQDLERYRDMQQSRKDEASAA